MPLGRVFDIGAAIVVVAGVTVVVSANNTSGIITAVGNTFINSLKAAMGSFG